MRFAITLSVLFLAAGVASAEIAVGSSVEWLTCSADFVAVGRITKHDRKGNVEHCTMEISDVIHARVMPGNKPSVSFQVDSVFFSPAQALKSKKGVLMFLKSQGGMLTPCDHYALVDLSNPGKYVIDQRERALRDPKEILDTCRKAASAWSEFTRKNPGAKVQRDRQEVNIGSPAGQALFGGSSVYMYVPKFVAK
jgi:hypothetical protein